MKPIDQIASCGVNITPPKAQDPQESNPAYAAAIRAELDKLSRQLESVKAQVENDDTQEDLALKALALYAVRRKCGEFSQSAPMPNTPGFDIMLDLYYQAQVGRKVSVSCAAIASGCPASTALRWVHRICEEELARVVPDLSDKRRRFVELSHAGRGYIEACLKAFPKMCLTP